MKEITGIIGPDNSYRKIEYYDIYEFAKKKCLEYASKSEENYNKFYWFSKEYKTFEPYLDFLLCRLGYTIVNPMSYHNVIEYGNKGTDRITFKEVEDLNKPLKNLKQKREIKSRIYKRCSEPLLKIRDFEVSLGKDGIILPNGKIIILNRDEDEYEYHEMIAIEILNQYLIKYKDLYEDYLKYTTGIFDGTPIDLEMIGKDLIVTSYLYDYLGCIECFYIYPSYDYTYNSHLLTERTNKIVEALEQNPDNHGDDFAFYEDSCNMDVKKYQKIIKSIYKEKVTFK